ncbi:MAG: methyltransferase family protein [Deltaproteobacteria bacterium]|nr:methyltransferase family protein [Deltaproteobacteria bacterium]
MHQGSFDKMKAFRDGYLPEYRDSPLEILDIGSQIVTERQLNYRPLFGSPPWSYTGMDIEAGENVDVVVRNPPDGSERWRDSCVVLQKPRLDDRERARFHERVEMQKRALPGMEGGFLAPLSPVPDRRPPSGFAEMTSRDVFTRFEREREEEALRQPLRLRRRLIRKRWKAFVRSFTQPLRDWE